jgi:hypothetical protein
MLRKCLFLGLTLVLVVALIYLFIYGKQLEKQPAGTSEEITQESEATPTRVLSPQDLEVVQPKLRLEKVSSGKDQSQTAWHAMEILNKGKVVYGGILLTIDYMDSSGKVLATKAHAVEKSIAPATALNLAEIKAMGLPVPVASCRIEITYADIASASKRKQPK